MLGNVRSKFLAGFDVSIHFSVRKSVRRNSPQWTRPYACEMQTWNYRQISTLSLQLGQVTASSYHRKSEFFPPAMALNITEG